MVEISLSGVTSGSWTPYQDDLIHQVGEKLLLNIEQLESRIADDTSDFALTLTPDVAVKSLVPWLERLAMVELAVTSFTDGRVFSQSRALRDIGFKGEIKVSGPIMPDQAHFFARVGVDTLVVDNANRLGDFKSVLERFNIFYQSSADAVTPVSKLRHDKLVDKHAERKAS